jgi:hypothetical protein
MERACQGSPCFCEVVLTLFQRAAQRLALSCDELPDCPVPLIWLGFCFSEATRRLAGSSKKRRTRQKKNSQNVKHFSLKDFAGFLPISKIRRRLSLDFSPTSSDGK